MRRPGEVEPVQTLRDFSTLSSAAVGEETKEEDSPTNFVHGPQTPISPAVSVSLLRSVRSPMPSSGMHSRICAIK
jgi:hypothetical protein